MFSSLRLLCSRSQKCWGGLADEVRKIGLEFHFGEAEVFSNVRAGRGVSVAKHVLVQGRKVEVLRHDGSAAYLGQEVPFEDHQDVELQNSLTKAWARFMVHKTELCSRHCRLPGRLKVFGSAISSAVLYGCGAWATAAEKGRKLRTAQGKMM